MRRECEDLTVSLDVLLPARLAAILLQIPLLLPASFRQHSPDALSTQSGQIPLKTTSCMANYLTPAVVKETVLAFV